MDAELGCNRNTKEAPFNSNQNHSKVLDFGELFDSLTPKRIKPRQNLERKIPTKSKVEKLDEILTSKRKVETLSIEPAAGTSSVDNKGVTSKQKRIKKTSNSQSKDKSMSLDEEVEKLFEALTAEPKILHDTTIRLPNGKLRNTKEFYEKLFEVSPPNQRKPRKSPKFKILSNILIKPATVKSNF